MSILVGEQIILTNTFLVDGAPTDPTTATLTITDPAGVVTSYTWPAPLTLTRTSEGIFTQTITATVVGTWTYVWTGTGAAADIAPGFFYVGTVTPSYVTLAEIRALPNLENTTDYTNAKIASAIEWFETLFEEATGVAWVPRTVTESLSGKGGTHLFLRHLFPRSLLAASTTTEGVATPFTAPELADVLLYESGVAVRLTLGTWLAGNRNISVTYSHGFDSPPPDVVEAAKVAIREHLIEASIGNRQFSVATQDGIARSSLPGKDRSFGIPVVDEVVARRNHRVPGLA